MRIRNYESAYGTENVISFLSFDWKEFSQILQIGTSKRPFSKIKITFFGRRQWGIVGSYKIGFKKRNKFERLFNFKVNELLSDRIG